MKTFNDHPYQQYANQKDSSEYYHLQQIRHFQERFDWKVFQKTPEEKQILKTRMYSYPNKNHCPVPPNN
jgi:hypothetical protein